MALRGFSDTLITFKILKMQTFYIITISVITYCIVLKISLFIMKRLYKKETEKLQKQLEKELQKPKHEQNRLITAILPDLIQQRLETWNKIQKN